MTNFFRHRLCHGASSHGHRSLPLLGVSWSKLGKAITGTERIYPQSGHTAQIIRMLDHFYEAFYKLKGYKPISEEQFIRRKQMIISSV